MARSLTVRVEPPPGLDWKRGAIIGRRLEQQDAARDIVTLVGDRSVLLVIVADGMGGAVGGRVASTVAAAAFEERFLAAPGQDLPARLSGALQAANNALALEIDRDRSLQGMGCTLVAVVTDGREASWISVGDSLLLMADRPGHLERLNEDHSLGALLDQAAKRGEITRQEAETSYRRNMLRSALTGQAIALIDRGTQVLKPGARLLLATDGILTLAYDRIRQLAAEAPSPVALTTAILDAVEANMPDDQDNLTVAVVDTPRPAPSRAPSQPTPQLGTPLWAKATIGIGATVFVLAIAALVALHWPRSAAKSAQIPAPQATPPKQPSDPSSGEGGLESKLRVKQAMRGSVQTWIDAGSSPKIAGPDALMLKTQLQNHVVHNSSLPKSSTMPATEPAEAAKLQAAGSRP
jgi:serine/threonine protein phosphatase PrpC